jgi:hypothetical protein
MNNNECEKIIDLAVEWQRRQSVQQHTRTAKNVAAIKASRCG